MRHSIPIAAIVMAFVVFASGTVVTQDARPRQAVVETTAGTFVIDLTP